MYTVHRLLLTAAVGMGNIMDMPMDTDMWIDVQSPKAALQATEVELSLANRGNVPRQYHRCNGRTRDQPAF